MTPAARVITAFGGARRLSELSGIHLSEVYRWDANHSRGRGGRIPDKYQRRILKAARENNVGLAPGDLVET